MRTKTKIKAGIIVVCWWPEHEADSQAGTGLYRGWFRLWLFWRGRGHADKFWPRDRFPAGFAPMEVQAGKDAW